MGASSSAITLLSSGLDSTVATALALAEGYSIRLALTFDYGQRAAQQEISHAQRWADFWGVEHRVLDLPFFNLSKSGLLKTQATPSLPHPTLTELDDPTLAQKSADQVWVPNRNGVFLEIAAAFAEQLDAQFLIVGFNREEAATFPDNSSAYRESLNQAFTFSTANHVTVISPTEHFNKREIVRKAIELGLPLQNIWSCYAQGEVMCGRCESCMRLKRAFNSNEVNSDAFFANSHL